MSQDPFADLGVSAPIVKTLARREVHTPFPIQSLVLPDALAGRDVLARSQTGSGKTLAFAIPMAERLAGTSKRPVALVLVPTRELAAQVVEECTDVARAKDLRVAAVYGGVSIREQAKALSAAHIVVGTPGRVEDLANRGLLHLQGIRILVLDEADRMLDMGFQPQVDKIVRRVPKDRQTMFFSATLTGAVAHIAHAYTRDPIRHDVEALRQTVEEVEHHFIPVSQHEKVAKLAEILKSKPGLGLVFVRTKRGADRLVKRLRPHGISASAMHGDLTQSAREKALRGFRAGTVSTLVATDVAARGLDVEDIAHVVNYDPPEDDAGYVHRVGRTARAGRSGAGLTLVLPDQRADVSRIAARLKLAAEFENGGMEVAPPRVVYQSRRGRRSLLYRPSRSA